MNSHILLIYASKRTTLKLSGLNQQTNTFFAYKSAVWAQPTWAVLLFLLVIWWQAGQWRLSSAGTWDSWFFLFLPVVLELLTSGGLYMWSLYIVSHFSLMAGQGNQVEAARHSNAGVCNCPSVNSTPYRLAQIQGRHLLNGVNSWSVVHWR